MILETSLGKREVSRTKERSEVAFLGYASRKRGLLPFHVRHTCGLTEFIARMGGYASGETQNAEQSKDGATGTCAKLFGAKRAQSVAYYDLRKKVFRIL